jgi:hypothetical protein
MRRLALRSVAAAGVVATAVASLARAMAPGDQYGLFDSNATWIQDKKTALNWQRYASTTPVSFADAAGVCASMSLATGSTLPWRVPSYKELLTIVDESPQTEYDNGQLVSKAIDTHAFPQTPVDLRYWTSSVYPPASSGQAYAVRFSDGNPTFLDQGSLLYVRCVQ